MTEIENICEQIANLYRSKLPVASGKLKQFTYDFTWDGRYFNLVFNLEDYWKYIENGTKPHFPPLSAIEEWIKIKRIIPRPYKGKVPSTKQLAYLIGRKISKVGTPAHNSLKLTLNESELFINELKEILLNKLLEETYGDTNILS